MSVWIEQNPEIVKFVVAKASWGKLLIKSFWNVQCKWRDECLVLSGRSCHEEFRPAKEFVNWATSDHFERFLLTPWKRVAAALRINVFHIFVSNTVTRCWILSIIIPVGGKNVWRVQFICASPPLHSEALYKFLHVTSKETTLCRMWNNMATLRCLYLLNRAVL